MLLRNKKAGNHRVLFAIFFFIICFFSPPFALAENAFISFYQKHLSAVDGNRCPMVPSCSTYAADAIKKHGPILGWAMACDRLVRCGGDEKKISPTIIVNKQQYIFDPVKANDFWWFKKER